MTKIPISFTNIFRDARKKRENLASRKGDITCFKIFL